MDFVFSILIFLALTILLIIAAFSLLLVRIFVGKSIGHPEYAPIDGTVFHQLSYFDRLYDYQTEVSRKHPTFRLLGPGQSEVYTVDPRNIEHVLKTKFDNYSKGEYNRDVYADLFGEGIFAVDGDRWRHQRKLASFEFSTCRVLRDFSCSVFRKNAAKLLGVVTEFVAQGLEFDVQDILMRSSLDSIFKVGFGVDLNCLDGSTKEGTEFMKAFDDASALIYWRYVDPFWKLKRFLNIGAEAQLRNNIATVDSFVHHLISTKKQVRDQRQHNDQIKDDILSRFLLESQKDPDKMNDRYLRDIILSFMIAGKDSTGSTLSWFFYMLCKNPIVQEKVFHEIRQVIGDDDGDGDHRFPEKITEVVLDRMHYLHAALTETLRLYPAVPIDGRCAETDDVLPDGYKLKKGDGLYYMIYSMGRTKSLWGDDADDFKPERWIRDGVFRTESPFKFIAFNAGPRTCLGKDFAYRQMKIVSMALIRFFRFQLADDKTTVTYRTMFTLQIKGGLHLRAIPRIKL